MWQAGEQAPDLSGAVTMTATSVAAGIGWSWGSGTLTLLDGSQHQFKVSGLDVVAVGIKQPTGVGNVYHLKQLHERGTTMRVVSIADLLACVVSLSVIIFLWLQ